MNNRNNNQRNGWTSGALAAGVVGALLGGAAYYYSRDSKEQPAPAAPTREQRAASEPQPRQAAQSQDDTSISSYLTNMLSRMSTVSGSKSNSTTTVQNQVSNAPSNPDLTNLNGLLHDIFMRFIKLKQEDFDLHYRVFDKIFQDLHKKMKEVDPYYRKYSSTVQFAGSHYDNLRIKKPDEFDMDIVIGLPLNIRVDSLNPAGSDIAIEPKSAGFVQLKMGIQFQRLPMRDAVEWLNNKAAYEWKDDSNYLLRSKFTDWFKSVVTKALNLFDVSFDSKPLYYVDGVPYIIDRSESGPAVTLLIKNKSRNFQLDVDLVPALKFPEDRWPIGPSYRSIAPNCRTGYWMVVGKPNKASPSQHDQMRSWRIALHNQEGELMYNSNNMKQAIRLMKKLRDAQGMKKVASYYIKTLFFWEIVERNNKEFWVRNNPATLFKIMVGKFHAALVAGKIPYFWNKNNNLIGNVERRVLDSYAAKLVPFMAILERPADYKLIAKYLLTPEEFMVYNERFLHI